MRPGPPRPPRGAGRRSAGALGVVAAVSTVGASPGPRPCGSALAAGRPPCDVGRVAAGAGFGGDGGLGRRVAGAADGARHRRTGRGGRGDRDRGRRPARTEAAAPGRGRRAGSTAVGDRQGDRGRASGAEGAPTADGGGRGGPPPRRPRSVDRAGRSAGRDRRRPVDAGGVAVGGGVRPGQGREAVEERAGRRDVRPPGLAELDGLAGSRSSCGSRRTSSSTGGRPSGRPCRCRRSPPRPARRLALGPPGRLSVTVRSVQVAGLKTLGVLRMKNWPVLGR